MARCSGIRTRCIIVSSLAVRPKRQRQRQRGGGPCAAVPQEELNSCCGAACGLGGTGT